MTEKETTLEHDPNNSRRKRRKTDKQNDIDTARGSITKCVSSQRDEGPGGDLQTLPDSTPPADDKVLRECTDNFDNYGSSTNEQRMPDATSQPKSQPSTPTTHPVCDVIQHTDADTKKSPTRKTIKLNSNGKLLSSPAHKSSENGKKRTGRKSKHTKSGAKKGAVDESKMVILRYSKGTEDGFAILVDNILNSRTRHVPPQQRQAPVVPPVKRNEPPKTTHPFFMKKPSRKPDPLNQPTNPDDEQNMMTFPDQKNTQPLQNSSPFTKTFTSFKHRPSKLPEPAAPIWPPRDLSHVRGLESNSTSQQSDICYALGLGPKKEKMAAVSIRDDESVLSADLQGLHNDPPRALRIPGRNVASGHVLQTAVTRQLSHNSLCGTQKDSLSNTCHPAIAGLHSSIPDTLSPFDRGELDGQLWGQKYAPNSVDQVLQVTREVTMLRDWLKILMVSAVDTGKLSKGADKTDKKDEKARKKRKKSDKLDGFIVSSSDEDYQLDEVSSDDELAGDVTVTPRRTVIRSGDGAFDLKFGGEKGRFSNAILVSGPSGCGKTASVYAVAKELDFEVFEINPGSRRNARDILERVGDMTRNHLVHNMNGGEEKTECPSLDATTSDVKQNKLNGFFRSSGVNKKKSSLPKEQERKKENDQKRTKQQKQSFILLEEADVLFEEDKQFWSGVLTLISQSRRPIIITCNDENLIPVNDISPHAILRFRAPPQHIAVDYLLLLAANEGHLLKREALNALYASTGKDLRRSIAELNFWCQMAVGSEKSGLDWIIDRWPRGCDLDEDGNRLRVISLNTYERYMGWFSRDIILSDRLDGEVEPERESLAWWQLSLQDSEQMSNIDRVISPTEDSSKERQLKELRHFSDLMDSRSALDILSIDCPLDHRMDILDTSTCCTSEKQRANYIEGYPLLGVDLIPSHYSSLREDVASTFHAFIRRTFQPSPPTDIESTQAAKVLAKITQPKSAGSTHTEFLRSFAPIMRTDYVFPPPTGRAAPSFENGLQPIAEDLGPYIRAIMAFDLRLEQHRLQLSGLLSQEVQGTKRVRKTRASRAALEGGNKADTRKERWFPPDTNASLVLGTGKREWQDLLVRNGERTGIGEF
ncbi:hypothetical protein FE257_001513 [Aspergillus nanangensis]|uniref:AAA+ ATPase domain-containing protein n=1 Tax=Aspergillus nanangensis TaxID=2582783 RepID=A0AAD4GX76_ASPNN|nr:hypothetical protein FE257_001513 [Aspergillus nanangensis]